MEMRAGAVPAREREPQRRDGERSGEQHHGGGQPVGDQHDAEGGRPAAEAINVRRGEVGARHEERRDAEKRERAGEAERGLRAMMPVIDEQERPRDGERQDDRRDDQVLDHSAGSSPSTWSVPVSPRAASSTTRRSAVVAKAITIAVSTSACGSGSANAAASTGTPRSTKGGRPPRTQPMTKMKRLTAYESSDSPSTTWKVRGRSSSHTPQPASRPMPRAMVSSIGGRGSTGARARAG